MSDMPDNVWLTEGELEGIGTYGPEEHPSRNLPKYIRSALVDELLDAAAELEHLEWIGADETKIDAAVERIRTARNAIRPLPPKQDLWVKDQQL